MNDKIKNNLEEILGYLKTAVEEGINQVPIVIEEILTYYTIYHCLLAIILAVATVGLIIAGNKLRKLTKNENAKKGYEPGMGFVLRENDIEEDCHIGAVSILTYTAAVITFISTFVNIFNFIKIQVAPRLYLLEYISEFLK